MRATLPFGLTLLAACGGVDSTPTQSTGGALYTYSYNSFTGSYLSSVSYTTYSGSLYLSTNQLLGDNLSPVAGLGPNGPSIYGSSLGGVSVDGTSFGGLDLIGTELVGQVDEETSVKLRIDDVKRGEGSNDDVLYYAVSEVGADGAATRLCGSDDAGAPIYALAMPGAWDRDIGRPGAGGYIPSDNFFFACQGSSVAKCFEMGFKPWRFEGHGANATSHHEACVRALRADYCGDGTSWTEAGVELSVWSEAGASPAAGHTFEAAWGTDGAVCINQTRLGFEAGEGPSCVRRIGRCQETPSDAVVLFSGFAGDGSSPVSAPAASNARASKANKK